MFAGTAVLQDLADQLRRIARRCDEYPVLSGMRSRHVDCVTSDGLACTNSQFLAMNSAGIAAGFIGAQQPGEGWVHHQAAVLLPDNTVIVAPLPPRTHKTKATAINDNGLVVVIQEIAWSQPRIFLWNLADETCRPIDANGAGNAFPIGIDASGRVLGQARDVRNQIFAVWGTVDGGWTRLGAPNGYAPAATSPRGDVVGTYRVDDIQRPWLLLASGELRFLPFVRQHHCYPSGINDARQIVGGASANHGSHALLWSP